jgi:hypothetical protein
VPESGALTRVSAALDAWLDGRLPRNFDQLRTDLRHILDCTPETHMRERGYRVCLDTHGTPGGGYSYCVLALGHTGLHQSGPGTTWESPEEPALCGARCTDIVHHGPPWECALDRGHQGHHTDRNGGHWSTVWLDSQP